MSPFFAASGFDFTCFIFSCLVNTCFMSCKTSHMLWVLSRLLSWLWREWWGVEKCSCTTVLQFVQTGIVQPMCINVHVHGVGTCIYVNYASVIALSGCGCYVETLTRAVFIVVEWEHWPGGGLGVVSCRYYQTGGRWETGARYGTAWLGTRAQLVDLYQACILIDHTKQQEQNKKKKRSTRMDVSIQLATWLYWHNKRFGNE